MTQCISVAKAIRKEVLKGGGGGGTSSKVTDWSCEIGESPQYRKSWVSFTYSGFLHVLRFPPRTLVSSMYSGFLYILRFPPCTLVSSMYFCFLHVLWFPPCTLVSSMHVLRFPPCTPVLSGLGYDQTDLSIITVLHDQTRVARWLHEAPLESNRLDQVDLRSNFQLQLRMISTPFPKPLILNYIIITTAKKVLPETSLIPI